MATKKSAIKKPTVKKSGFDEFVEEGTSSNDATNLALTTPQSAMGAYTDQAMIDTNDVFIPNLRLAQALTAEVTNGSAKSGQWVISGEDAMNKATIIPLLMNKRRELRDPDEGRQVLCRSNDSVTGIGDPGGNCGTCPMARWTEGKGKNAKNRAPECSFIYSYVIYLVETDSVCILEFSRTSIPAGKMLNTMILQKGLGKFAAQLSASSSKGPKGTYHSPVVNGAKVTDKIMKQALLKKAEVFG